MTSWNNLKILGKLYSYKIILSVKSRLVKLVVLKKLQA